MAKKEAKSKKENNKNKKSFFKDFKAELKKVIWPTPKQLINNTVAVVTVVLVTAAIVFVLDLAFETLNKQGINKVKEIVGTTSSTSEETTENDSEETTENSTDGTETEPTENETTDVSPDETSDESATETSNEEAPTETQNAEAQNEAE